MSSHGFQFHMITRCGMEFISNEMDIDIDSETECVSVVNIRKIPSVSWRVLPFIFAIHQTPSS